MSKGCMAFILLRFYAMKKPHMAQPSVKIEWVTRNKARQVCLQLPRTGFPSCASGLGTDPKLRCPEWELTSPASQDTRPNGVSGIFQLLML